MRSLLFFVILCRAGMAQLGGPIIGYVPEGTQIRTMYGLPAAGAIGAAINPGRDFAQIVISPQQNFAIAVDAATGDVLIVKPASVSAINGVGSNPSFIAVSPTGTSAALWFAATGQMQIVTGLPTTPVVSTLNLSFMNASPSAMAVSDDGQWAVGLFSGGATAFGPNGQAIPLQTDAGILATSFFHNSHDLALANSARATIITDVGGANQPGVLYDYSTQSLLPRGIGVSFDNQLALVANGGGKLVDISVANRTATVVDCGCSPTGVYGLGDALFRLNGTGGPSAMGRTGPRPELKLFDAAAGAVWIVPPALVQTGGRQ